MMSNEDKAQIFDFLLEILKKGGRSKNTTDALIDYLKKTSEDESAEKLLMRISKIFNQDINSYYSSYSSSNIELLRKKIEKLEEIIEDNKRSGAVIQWNVIQGIVWVITLAASIIAIYLSLRQNL